MSTVESDVLQPNNTIAAEPPAPVTQDDGGIHLSDAQVTQTAERILDVGEVTLWFDDYDARLDEFARVVDTLDADSGARLFSEIVEQDPGAFRSWLDADRLTSLGDANRIGASETQAVIQAFAGSYADGEVTAPEVESFFGFSASSAPGYQVEAFNNARTLLKNADGPQVDAFVQRYAADVFSIAANPHAGIGASLRTAFAATLLNDTGGGQALAQAFTDLTPDMQRAVASQLAFSGPAYESNNTHVPELNVENPLTLLVDAVQGNGLPSADARGTLLNIADGLSQNRHGSRHAEPVATQIYRDVAAGIAQDRAANPQLHAEALGRVATAEARAQSVLAQIEPGASPQRIGEVVNANRETLVNAVFTQYYELRGDQGRALSGAALRNEIGLAMGLTEITNLPRTAADQAQVDAGTWDFFSGEQLQAIRAVEAQIVDVGGTDALVTALPVTVTAENGTMIQAPLFRVETADGQTRFVDFNPADQTSRQYSDFTDWRENNQLPPGQMSYALDGHLTADANGQVRIETENTPNTVDTFWEQWGQPVLDGAALVGGVVLVGAAIVGTGGTALLVGGGLLAAYGGIRGGEVLIDRATHGETLSLADAEARNAWINVGASAIGFAAAGASLRAASLAGNLTGSADDAARALTWLNAARATNVAAQYADTAAVIDTGWSLAANWDQLTPQQRLTAIAQMSFWAGGTAVSARQAGGIGNLYGASDIAQGLSQANQWLRSQLPDGAQVQQVLSSLPDNLASTLPANYTVERLVTPDGVEIMAIVRHDDAGGSGPVRANGAGDGAAAPLRTSADVPPASALADYPDAQPITLDARGLHDGNHNGAPNARRFDDWIAEGGTVRFDADSQTYLYGQELQLSDGTTRFVEIAYVQGPPDGQARPDFSEYSETTVAIEGMSGLPERDTRPVPGDFSKAWQAYENQLVQTQNMTQAEARQYIADTYGIRPRTRGAMAGHYPDRSPTGYTWHHHQDGQSLLLVDFTVHSTFTHTGGASLSRD